MRCARLKTCGVRLRQDLLWLFLWNWTLRCSVLAGKPLAPDEPDGWGSFDDIPLSPALSAAAPSTARDAPGGAALHERLRAAEQVRSCWLFCCQRSC